MKISIIRTGGFMGMRKEISLDLDNVDEKTAKQIAEQLATIGFFQIPEKADIPQRGADYFLYQVTVVDENGTRTVSVAEPSMSDEFRQLIKTIESISERK